MRKYKSQKDVPGQFCRIRESIAPIHEYSVFALEQLSSPFRLTVTIRQKDFFPKCLEAGVGDSVFGISAGSEFDQKEKII